MFLCGMGDAAGKHLVVGLGILIGKYSFKVGGVKPLKLIPLGAWQSFKASEIFSPSQYSIEGKSYAQLPWLVLVIVVDRQIKPVWFYYIRGNIKQSAALSKALAYQTKFKRLQITQAAMY